VRSARGRTPPHTSPPRRRGCSDGERRRIVAKPVPAHVRGHRLAERLFADGSRPPVMLLPCVRQEVAHHHERLPTTTQPQQAWPMLHHPCVHCPHPTGNAMPTVAARRARAQPPHSRVHNAPPALLKAYESHRCRVVTGARSLLLWLRRRAAVVASTPPQMGPGHVGNSQGLQLTRITGHVAMMLLSLEHKVQTVRCRPLETSPAHPAICLVVS